MESTRCPVTAVLAMKRWLKLGTSGKLRKGLFMATPPAPLRAAGVGCMELRNRAFTKPFTRSISDKGPGPVLHLSARRVFYLLHCRNPNHTDASHAKSLYVRIFLKSGMWDERVGLGGMS